MVTKSEHLLKHKIFHQNLDEMLAEFIAETGSLPTQTSLLQFIEWSYKMTTEAKELPNG